MDNSLQARLFEQMEKKPGQRAIAFYNGSDEFSWYTLEQFFDQTVGYAAKMAICGLGKGDICVLVLPSSEFSARAVFATLLLGAVPLLVAPPFIQEQGAHASLQLILTGILDKTGPKVVVLSDPMAAIREELQKKYPKTRFLLGEQELSSTAGEKIQYTFPAETDLAAMQLTSGTTGFPRICVWRQKNVLAALDGMTAAMQLNPEDVCLNWTPLYHDMGLVNNFLLSLTTGVPLVMLSPHDFIKNPALWLRALHRTGATLTWSPNFGFAITAQRVRDEQIEGVRLDAVRAFWNAAERIHLESMLAFHQRFAPVGVRYESLKTNFGCAENIGGATFSDPEGSFVFEHLDRTAFYQKGTAQPVPDSQDDAQPVTVVGVGKPSPGMEVKILSKNGIPLPDGKIGEVALLTPSHMEGYLADPQETHRVFKGELLRTGDLGYLRDGELFWVGRVRERINVRGAKLDPSDFEPVLQQIDGLRHGCFAAFGVDDGAKGTQRIVVVSEVRSATPRKAEEMIAEIRKKVFLQLGLNLDDTLLVREGTLTKTSSGKRRHRYFKQLYLDGKLKDYEWRPITCPA